MILSEAFIRLCAATTGDVIITQTIGRVSDEQVTTCRVVWWSEGESKAATEDTLEGAVEKALEAINAKA